MRDKDKAIVSLSVCRHTPTHAPNLALIFMIKCLSHNRHQKEHLLAISPVQTLDQSFYSLKLDQEHKHFLFLMHSMQSNQTPTELFEQFGQTLVEIGKALFVQKSIGFVYM